MSKANLVELFEVITSLNTPDGIQASSWELFRGAIFGRDSLRVALDVMPWIPSISERVIFSLLRHQGTETNLLTEEEPGRIHHEYRHLFVGGRKVGREQQELLKRLAERWGGGENELTYYGTVDATPQLIRLVALYCRDFGRGILEEQYMHRKTGLRTVKESLLAAAQWLEGRISSSDLGLLEFCSTNPKGLKWQVLRDGRLSYLHTDGSIANWKRPIASIDAQGLAYDGLLYAAELFQEDEPEQAARWQQLAAKLQQATLERFWQPEEAFFVMAIDRDEDGKPRPLLTESSLPGELLETRIFDTLSEDDREKYVSAIVCKLFGPEFLTPVGIRSRSRKYHSLIPLWDYQGSKVSWVVMSNLLAIGLRKQGLTELAEDMENRIVNGTVIADGYPEFYYVDENNQVTYSYTRYKAPQTEGSAPVMAPILATNIPEAVQAWTVSALMRILLNREQPEEAAHHRTGGYWQKKLEQQIFSATPKTGLIAEAEARILAQTSPSRPIDHLEAKRIQELIFSGNLPKYPFQ